jgi:hypothetical protein
MRRSLILILAWLVLGSVAQAGEGRVIKVLPQFLDLQGQHAISPSLFDRDAYQAHLRKHPEEVSGVRYAVQWQSKPSSPGALKLRVELRGIGQGEKPRQTTVEKTITQPWRHSEWTNLDLAGADYKTFGEVTAWRVTLWDGTQLLGEQKSFLW